MNTDDINFAYKVRHALNEQLDTLPDATTERLAAARARALARKKADAPVRASAARNGFSLGALWSSVAGGGAGVGRIAVAVPLLAMAVGLAGVYQHEQQQHIAAMAEFDAAVLSDELPLTAYLDDGFNAYLAAQKPRQ